MAKPLSPGEYKALLALARYSTAAEAAKHLGLQEITVRNLSQRAYRKLGVSSRTEAYEALGWLRLPKEED